MQMSFLKKISANVTSSNDILLPEKFKKKKISSSVKSDYHPPGCESCTDISKVKVMASEEYL